MTSVKYFHSGMPGAPTLSGTAGHMINVLDGCLVNGFGKAGATDTLDSLVVSSDVATATIAAGHPFEADTVALIAGATPSGLNGEKKVLSVTATTFTFATSGISNQTATGTITSKLAPAGWEKAHSGTNLAAYRSLDVTGTRFYLRVDDTIGRSFKIRGYETMGSINDTSGLAFPTTLQATDLFIPKSYTANTTVRPWILVSDSRAFLLAVAGGFGGASTASCTSFMFGDFVSRKPSDVYACGIMNYGTSESEVCDNFPGTTTNFELSYCGINTETVLYLARGVSGIGGSSLARRHYMSPVITSTAATVSGAGPWAIYPNPGDNALLLSNIFLSEATPSQTIRGHLPGIQFITQYVGPNIFSNLNKLSGSGSLAGRQLLAIRSYSGAYLVDITGPWR